LAIKYSTPIPNINRTKIDMEANATRISILVSFPSIAGCMWGGWDGDVVC